MDESATIGKKTPSRARKSAAEKLAEKLQKETAKKTALAVQQQADLALLRLTKKKNPFQFSVMKRRETWTDVAQGLQQLLSNAEYDERRCRERVKKLMDDFKKDSKKHITGSGHIDPTENESILEYLVNQEEHTVNNQEAEREKEEASRRLTEDIQRAALERMKTLTAPEQVETEGNLLIDSYD